MMKWQQIVYRLSIALALAVAAGLPAYAEGDEIGRASCRERV